MSRPREPDPVKIITSVFSPEKPLIDEVIRALSEVFGPVDWQSGELYFDRTRYYAKEMGWPLFRRFLSFENLTPADALVDVKHKTNALENRYLGEHGRRTNIDPGFISAERLILATGKNYVHRVYLSAGIYADLTLIFKRGTYCTLPWTYPDYAEPGAIDMFNGIRETYMHQLREARRID